MAGEAYYSRLLHALPAFQPFIDHMPSRIILHPAPEV